MKKLFAALLSMMLVCGCMAGWAETTSLLPGGWAVYQGEFSVMHADTEEEIFDRAAPQDYEMIATLATQVVAGVNYAFLARNAAGWAVITVYVNAQGEAALRTIVPLDAVDYRTMEEPLPTGLVGGWTVQDTGKPPMLPTEEAEAAYETAVFAAERILKPIALLATQVVAGMNYRVLAQEAGVLYVVTVYQPLAGDAVILSLELLDLIAYVTE